jgi:hypothetical protein
MKVTNQNEEAAVRMGREVFALCLCCVDLKHVDEMWLCSPLRKIIKHQIHGNDLFASHDLLMIVNNYSERRFSLQVRLNLFSSSTVTIDQSIRHSRPGVQSETELCSVTWWWFNQNRWEVGVILSLIEDFLIGSLRKISEKIRVSFNEIQILKEVFQTTPWPSSIIRVASVLWKVKMWR